MNDSPNDGPNDRSDSETGPAPHNRGVELAFAIVLGLAVTGFLVGVRAGPGSASTSHVPLPVDMPRELVAKVHGVADPRIASVFCRAAADAALGQHAQRLW